jgi:hypothetical protein
MKSKILFILSIIFLLIFAVRGSGCVDENSLINNSNSINYDNYLNLIWINDYYPHISFFINTIENGVINGKLSVNGMIAMPSFYFYSFDSVNFCDLTGMITDGVAECTFDDGHGNQGIIKLTLLDNKIEAAIEFISKRFSDINNITDGIYIFEPYNLKHLNDFMINTSSSTIDLNSWGTVNFVTILIDGRKPYPTAFLTNEHDDILYQFGAYQVGSEIIDVLIEDVNGDGLKDVKITTDFEIEFLFIQMENGLFYSSKLLESPINDVNSWVGSYELFEFIENSFGSNHFRAYSIIIYKQDEVYFADVIIDGWQTMIRARALVRGNYESIDLVFHSYLPDSIMNEFYDEGDVLLSFTRSEDEIITTWVKIQSIWIDKTEPGVYFELIA